MKTSVRRFLAASTATAVAMVGALSMSTGEAVAVAKNNNITNYGFNGWAYGTYVSTGPVGVKSAPTAYSWMGCTRMAGLVRNRSVAAVNLPIDSPFLKVGAVASRSRTYKSGKLVGMRSTNRVASVRLGAANSLNLTITGLSTTADAHARAGKFGTSANFSSVRIAANTGTPLDDILNKVGAGVDDLIRQLTKNGGELKLPGLGVIRLGQNQQHRYKTHAYANVAALNVQLYGATPNDPKDDIRVVIGRSFARIAKDVPSAVVGGGAQVVSGKVLDGAVTVGPVSERTVPCEGTRGVVRKSSTVGADLLNAGVLKAGVLQARAYGRQLSKGRAAAWTDATVADITLGVGDSSLVIKGVVGRASVRRAANGKIVKTTKGSRVASIRFGGKAYAIPAPGKPLDILGLVKIESMVKSTSPTMIQVIALRVTVLGEHGVVLNLGKAKASVRRT